MPASQLTYADRDVSVLMQGGLVWLLGHTLDLRVSKTDSSGTSAQVTDGTAPASPVLKDARAVYTPGLSERAGSASKFYHTDRPGSTRCAAPAVQTARSPEPLRAAMNVTSIPPARRTESSPTAYLV